VGTCYIEFGGGMVGMVEANFLGGPAFTARLVGSSREMSLTMVVDQKAATVEKFPTRGLFELTRDGVPIWVNVANVLYLEPVKVID
jgi:hypothetical protein